MIGTHGSHAAGFQCSEQGQLDGKGGVADLVKEQRAALRGNESPDPVGVRTGESALLVTEELAGDEILGDGRAMNGKERSGVSRRGLVDDFGEMLLAGTRLAQQEDGQLLLGDG